MANELTGKVTLITGAGRGLGRQMALDFAARGARLCLASRTVDELHDVALEVRHLGGEALDVATDVGDGTQVKRLFAAARSHFGGVDVLINNAGSFPVGPIAEFEEDEWDRSMRVDLKSFYVCSRSALIEGGMLERGDGHILNIASVSVRRQVPNLAVHCSLKAGVLAFSESLRREVANEGVRVSIICPGTIDTGLVEGSAEQSYVHGRDKWLSTADVSDLVTYVASRDRSVNISEVTIVGA